jgi:hypothetical protein
LDCPAHGKAVHVRHHRVEHDDVGQGNGKRFERGDAIFRVDDLEPRLESLPTEKALHLAVIDEQDDGIGVLIIHSVSGDLGQAV